jgi:peptide/nickel transport system ATP-binding protein
VTAPTASAAPPVVDVRALRVTLTGTNTDVVDEASLTIRPGEVLGLVGESGCGKTTLGMALLGYCRDGARIASGGVRIDGRDVAGMDERHMTALRGRVISCIPQDPPASLNPALRVGRQLREVLDTHAADWTRQEREARYREVLADVLLPAGSDFARRYPHQLSGGQQQRLMIAMAVACRPKVLVCDEPTTGLDVTTQKHVLDTLRQLCSAQDIAVLYISHDLAVVASLADRVAVMYAGRIVESGRCEQLFSRPRHPYTRRLLHAVPSATHRQVLTGIPGHAPAPGHRPPGCAFAPRCTRVQDRCHEAFPPADEVEPGHVIRCYFPETDTRPREDGPAAERSATQRVLSVDRVEASYGPSVVLTDVSLTLQATECLALLGESGSGKTTLARCIVGLHPHYRGDIRLGEAALERSARRRSDAQRRSIQYVFQNPYTSFNPRHSVGRCVATPLRLFSGLRHEKAAERVRALLEQVELPAATASRFPDELSGGERQRVAIARALAAEPEVLVCDEITSALDVSVQAAIVSLLAELQKKMGLSLLFITHDLALVRSIADRVAVLHNGRIAEIGPTAEVCDNPKSDYTRALFRDTQALEEPRPAT